MQLSDHTFIVGDIHGCFDEFMLLLERAKYSSKKHRLILVGDVINKGPHSFKALNWVHQNKVESVIGNHELKFIQLVESQKEMPFFLEQLKKDMGIHLCRWVQYLKTWPSYIEEEDFLVVHGGLVPNEHPSESQKGHLTNLRFWDEASQSRIHSSHAKPWHDYYTNQKLVVYGHWARQGLLQKSNSIGLDSGCVYGNQLSGVWLPSRTIVQVNAISI